MNRGSLAEDPREGLSSSSRYSRMGGERNSLLYVDSSMARKARKAAESRMRAYGGAAEGNHNLTAKKSVGRGLADSHMDRLEVGSDGRLFHVKENRKNAPKSEPAQNAEAVREAGTSSETVVQAVPNPPVIRAAKPVRPYLDAAYKNPLLSGSNTGKPQIISVFHTDFFSRNKIRILAAAVAAAAALYGYTAWHYRNRFYPGTSFFGISAAQMSVYDMKAAVRSKVDSYTLELAARDPSGSVNSDAATVNDAAAPEDNVITAADIDLKYVDDGAIDHAMQAQHSWAWPVMMIANAVSGQKMELETSFDRERVPEVLSHLACFRKENVILPENAHIELTDDGAVVAPEVYGTKLKADETAAAVVDALEAGDTQISLDRLGLYEAPTVFSSDILLMTEAQALNKVLGAKITLSFGDSAEVLNSEVIRTLLSKRDGNFYVDEEKVRSYVSKLADKYDTYQKARTFYTSLGTTVNLEEGTGDYGWQLDQESTYEQVLEGIRAQKQMTLEPVWNHEGYCSPSKDLGDTYVEISLTTQTMWFYKDGSLVVKTPVVTGNPYAGHETPSGGVWALKDHMRNALLSGEGYRAPVDYWMPFNGGVGIHDLQSRYWFGGNVYLGGGSHGCINTPLSAVKLIYDGIEIGVPVIVYKDESETAMEMKDGPYDSGSLKTLIEETYGTVEDDGQGSIVYWTAQKKTQAAAAQTTQTAAPASGGVW